MRKRIHQLRIVGVSTDVAVAEVIVYDNRDNGAVVWNGGTAYIETTRDNAAATLRTWRRRCQQDPHTRYITTIATR